MSTGHSPQDDADLKDFLAHESPVSIDYDNLELVEPTAALDATILAAAKAAVMPVAKPAPASAAPPVLKPPAPMTAPARPPPPPVGDDDDGDTATLPAVRRPRWMVPAALAASVLVAVGFGVAMLDLSPSIKEARSGLAAQFAKRARARNEADKAAAEAAAEAAAAQEVEVMVMEAPPPPPFLEPDRPQVADLEASIALIRRELIAVDQTELPEDALAATALSRSAADPASVIQPRDRRLAKILELYDAGNPDLARDALEIYLRDFADDPISQSIIGRP